MGTGGLTRVRLRSVLKRIYAWPSVGIKLGLVALCIGVVAGGASAWSIYQTHAEQIRDDFADRVVLIARTVEAATLVHAQPKTDQARLVEILQLQAQLEALKEREPSILRINVYTEYQGRPLIVGSSQRELLGATPDPESQAELNVDGMETVITEEEEIDGQHAYGVLVPLRIEGQPPLTIGVHLSTVERDEELVAVQRAFGRTLAIEMALALVVVYVIVRLLVSRPLHRLTRAATLMRHGEYSARVPGAHDASAGDEIIRLSAHFNVMAEAIETLHDQTKALASTDPLTGLYNRRFVLEVLQREIERSRREGLPLAVMMLDLDGFKAVNDKFGHTVGDAALLHVAEALEKNARAADLTARFGGDEFVILLPNCDAGSLQSVMERVRQGIAGLDPPRSGDGVPLQITVSAGGTLLRSDDSLDSLMNRADLALFEAKNAGRNQVRLAA